MARVSRETAATHRKAMVRAASRLFRARGLDGVGVAEITRAAGLTHGGFYGHFASKEALAAEAVGAAFEEGRVRLETRGLEAWLRGYLSRGHRDRPDEGCPLLAFPSPHARLPDEVATELAGGAARLLDAVAERLPALDGEDAESRARRAAALLATHIEDAGAALSFLDLFDRIQGGTLTVSARLDGPGTSIGTLRLLAFHLLEEPKAGRITASKEGADGIRQVPIRRAEIDRSTNFDRASVHFAMHDGIIDVTEGVAKGASVGATATGQIDVAAQRLSLSGTYIPAYGLNNLAGRIPILGAIAGAGSNEGLVGVTFRVVGAIDDPILQIPPHSAVAPGIFRRIFEFQNEEMPQGGGDPNAPTRLMPGDGPTKITP